MAIRKFATIPNQALATSNSNNAPQFRRVVESEILQLGYWPMRLFAGTQWDAPPTCDRCGLAEVLCNCPPLPVSREPTKAPEKQIARVAVEKRKKGKVVTVIRDLSDANEQLEELLVKLKNAMGAGGTVKDSTIEVQGNHEARIRKLLAELKYRIK